jgi:hypothetical protein
MSAKEQCRWRRAQAIIGDDQGVALAMVVAVAAVLFILLTALVTVTVQQGVESSAHYKKAEVLDVADAGISAYIKLLKDNWYAYESSPTLSGVAGDGSWVVSVTPPGSGSSTVKLVSTGVIPSQGLRRVVTAYIRPPSFADYMFLINTDITFGATAVVYGKVHSNGNITVNSGGKLYGTASVTSGHSVTANAASLLGSPPKITNAKQIDFTTVTADLANMRSISSTQAALYLDPGNKPNGKPYLGYKVVFSGDNYSVSKVTSQTGSTGQIFIETSTTVTRSIPASGVLYFEDSIWVSGSYSKSVAIGDAVQTVASASATSANAASQLPNSAFYLYDNLRPTDVSDLNQMIGLIAPGDISFPSWYNYTGSPTSYTVQAALLSQNGGIHADYMSGRSKTMLNIYGSMVSQTPATFVSGSDGFLNRTYAYDTRFAVRTPPMYPRPVAYGGSQLVVSSWSDSP